MLQCFQNRMLNVVNRSNFSAQKTLQRPSGKIIQRTTNSAKDYVMRSLIVNDGSLLIKNLIVMSGEVSYCRW